jgi:3-oxoacyl-[acyl-carrier protein] reductase
MKTLITGFHSDLAQALIQRRRGFGDTVVATSTKPEGASTAECRVVGFDLGAVDGPHRELDQVLDGGIDLLILNAAGRVGELKPLHEVPYDELRQYMRVNIEGNLWLIQRVLPAMKSAGFGRILFISSVSAGSGTSGYGMYCCAKAALEGLIFNLSVDYGEFGIYSNVLRPGILATSRTQDFWSRPGYQKIVSRTIPAGKIGTCEQVAEATDPLLSKTSYINGAVLEVSGGLPRVRSRGMT